MGFDFTRNALRDLHARSFQRCNFLGIVREKTNLLQAQCLQNLCGKLEPALVGFETQLFVGFDCVESLILKLVGLELGHEPDASSFLLLIDQNAGPGLGDHGERHFQLLAAIATQRAEDVAGEALRVNAYQRRSRMDIAHHHGNGLFCATVAVKQAFKAHDAEVSPTRGEIGFGKFADGVFCTHGFIIDGATG